MRKRAGSRVILAVKHALFVAVIILLQGCQPSSQVDRDTGLVYIKFDPARSPAIVLVEEQGSLSCDGISARTQEVLDLLPQSRSFRDGVRFVEASNYRAYYLPRYLGDKERAAFVFCNGAKSAFIPANCDLVGKRRDRCYMTDILFLSELPTVIDAIERNLDVTGRLTPP